MAFKMSSMETIVKVFHFSHDTAEYLGSGDILIPAFTGLPAYCTDITPPDNKAGRVCIFYAEKNAWEYVEDFRGNNYYDKETGFPVIVTSLGPLPKNLTKQAPEGEFVKWDGDQWVNDEVAEKQYKESQANQLKARLLAQANEKISVYSDAVDMGLSTDDERALLDVWKEYRVTLNRVDTASTGITWPEVPE
ncbi:tail fiber assembly protein [Rahnella sp. SL6]|uniref:tail fiber assembly protein n=1 Tax=Rahnella perminowiae TaxID=2816244 RepID=UPI001C267367|nr:tail fiber assembly protein [Rahnella perminowiae]MBU9809542.1 tail fiber assembly protein [Rahnella perminowiae]